MSVSKSPHLIAFPSTLNPADAFSGMPGAAGDRGHSADPGSRHDMQEIVRLARTVLEKSPADLAAIADDNAAMQAGWVEAFEAHRSRASAEARFWESAIAYLMASTPSAIANDD